jgi:putative SOS response-associated peptidase YedK
MCGRYEAGQKQKIAEAFHVSVTLDDIYFGADKECTPGSIQPVVYIRDGERQMGEMRWGFKLPDRLVLNARSDKLTTSDFWQARLSNRCIVPASSMLEWKKTGTETGQRPKYRLSVKGRHVLGLAALWAPWKNPKTGQWEDTFAIITSDPNTKMSEIHSRQAIILEPREYAEWLNDSERPPVHLLRILPDDDLVVDPIQSGRKIEAKMETPEPPMRGLFDGM